VPLVVRRARRPAAEVRAELGLAPLDAGGPQIAVLIYGGHRAEIPVRADFLPPGCALRCDMIGGF
jgi:hypothetical protein